MAGAALISSLSAAAVRAVLNWSRNKGAAETPRAMAGQPPKSALTTSAATIVASPTQPTRSRNVL